MPTPDERQQQIQAQQTLLATHRRTLATLLQQQAALGSAHAPPGVAHDISEARAGIDQCKATLRGWGVDVDDHPNDVEPLDQRKTTLLGIGFLLLFISPFASAAHLSLVPERFVDFFHGFPMGFRTSERISSSHSAGHHFLSDSI